MKNEGLKNSGHSMGMLLDTKKFNFESQQWLRFHIWFIMTLYYKMRQLLLQNTTAIISQNVTIVCQKMRQVFYYKIPQFYYKMRHLLQNTLILLQNATVITIITIMGRVA